MTRGARARRTARAAGGLAALLALGAAGDALAVTIHVPADQPTLAAGLAAAASGDTVAAAPGTYPERLVLPPGVTLCADGVPGSVIVDAGGGGSAVVCTSPIAGTAIVGLVLRGGTGELDGGIREGGALLVRGGRLDLAGVRLEASGADLGGGLFADGAEVTWTGGSLAANTATYGGGCFAHAGRLVLQGVEISGNHATAGGAAYASSLDLFQAVSCMCHDNSAGGDGGALYLAATGAAINDSRFVSNGAGGKGGGLFLDAGTLATLSYVVLLDNRAAVAGGGLHATCGGTVGTACTQAQLFHVDLVYNHGPGPGAVSVDGTARVSVEASLVARNEGAFACLSPLAAVDVACTALFNNGPPPPSGSCTPTYTDTVEVDPRLCDVIGHDPSRCANSPLLTPAPCGQPFLGALGQGCADCGPTPTVTTSWGRIKARYR